MSKAPYGYVVELRSITPNGSNIFVTRSRIQPFIHVAEACVEHWKTLYTNDTWRFVIVPLVAEQTPTPAPREEGVDKSNSGENR